MTAGLDAELGVVRGDFALDLAVTVAPGEVVALLGPNGAGKSTALRALAGLWPLAAGRVVVGDAVLDDVALGVHVVPGRRRVGLVFQDYLLFPHLSARDNVAFGLRARGARRRVARARAGAELSRMGLEGVAGLKPRDLSGGQAQRVALARALVTEPRLLLLDEPLAALDAGARLQVRADLRRHLAGFTGATLLVTHDVLDAFALADRVVVLEHGRVVQAGAPPDVARHPRTDYVARLVGLNLYRGTSHGTHVRLDHGEAWVAAATAATGEVLVAFAPAAVTVHRHAPEGSARNTWPVSVTGLERHADAVRVHLSGALELAADLTPLSVAELQLAPGAEVWAAVKATEVRVYPR